MNRDWCVTFIVSFVYFQSKSNLIKVIEMLDCYGCFSFRNRPNLFFDSSFETRKPHKKQHSVLIKRKSVETKFKLLFEYKNIHFHYFFSMYFFSLLLSFFLFQICMWTKIEQKGKATKDCQKKKKWSWTTFRTNINPNQVWLARLAKQTSVCQVWLAFWRSSFWLDNFILAQLVTCRQEEMKAAKTWSNNCCER